VSPKPQYKESKRFLNLLWSGGLPEGCWITVAWKVSAKDWQHRHYKTLDQAAIAFASKALRFDTYVSCGVPRFKPEGDRRARAAQVSDLPGFWLDIDFGTVGHKKNVYPPSIKHAYQLLGVAPRPTLVVESGHGLQAWWLFDDPYRITDDVSRERFVTTFTELHDKVALAAQSREWSLDSTHNLARVLRPAGTLNHKVAGDAKPVLLAIDDGPRWSLEDIEKEINSEDRTIAVELTQPIAREEKIDAESSGIPWAGINSSAVARSLLAGDLLEYDSASERDAALAKVAVNNGASRENVKSLIRLRRITAKENPAKAERDDYIDLTYKFALLSDGEFPTAPDVTLVEWSNRVLPDIVLSEKHSVSKVLTYMVRNARGVRFMGTRKDIELGLGCDSKTVTAAWKCLERLGFTKPVNDHPSEGIAKGCIFLLPTPSNNQGNRFLA